MDVHDEGTLNVNMFIVACKLIKAAANKYDIPSTLPALLKATLDSDPNDDRSQKPLQIIPVAELSTEFNNSQV